MARRTSRAAAAKTETTPEPASTRRSHEDIVALVPAIVKKLKAGTTMTDIRAEYGPGPTIRKALAEAGYNTKGEQVKVDTFDADKLTDKQLAAKLAEMREEGQAWYMLALASGLSEAECKEVLSDNGFKELATGRVSVAKEEAEEEAKEEAKPARRSRSRAAAAKAEEPAGENDGEATPTRRRRRRGAAAAAA